MQHQSAAPDASDAILRAQSGRLLAGLYLLGAVVALLSPLLPPAPLSTAGVQAVALAALLIGLIAARVPWSRLPSWAPLPAAVAAFPLIALYNLFVGAEPFRYAVFFLWVFAYLGVSQPRGIAALFVVPFVPAYLAPLWLSGRATDVALASSVLAGAGGVVLGETIAWTMEGKRRALAKLARELRRQALHDPLTGLANRLLFRDRAEHAIALGQRERRPISVLLLDIDDFKTINDALGHEIGDQILARVAERIRASLRREDTVARMGGDEFAIVLEDGASEGAVDAARRFLAALGPPFQLAGHSILVRASIGIACGPSEASADELLRNADLAMYRAKSEARGGYRLFAPEMDAAARSRMTARANLVGALERDEFTVHYQPVVELASGRIVGFEALVRWQIPGGGLVPPGEFLPVVEELGLLSKLDAWVLRTACAQLREWGDELASGGDLSLGVNVTARDLREPGFAEGLIDTLADAGVQPSRVTLEVVESGLLDGQPSTRSTMDLLRRIGVSLAIDDFGTGYSSLAYLRDFRVDVLKIDASFTSALGVGGPTAKLAEAMITLGHSLGLQIVAEGIDHPRQLIRLADLGCRLGQGYLLSPPLTAPAATALLRAGRRVPAIPSRSARALGVARRIAGP